MTPVTQDQRATYGADYHRTREAYLAGTPLGPRFVGDQHTQVMGGSARVGTYVWTAAPGTGTTAMLLQLALSNPETPVIYLSAMMPGCALWHRLMANTNATTIEHYTHGLLSEEAYLAHEAHTLAQAGHITLVDAMDTADPWTVDRLEELALELKGNSRHVLVIIDSFNCWATGLGSDREERAHYDALLSALSAMAARTQAVVHLITERARARMDGGTHAAAGTMRFAATANAVFDLDAAERSEVVESAAAKTGARELILSVRTHRYGTHGVQIRYRFDPVLMRVAEITDIAAPSRVRTVGRRR